MWIFNAHGPAILQFCVCVCSIQICVMAIINKSQDGNKNNRCNDFQVCSIQFVFGNSLMYLWGNNQKTFQQHYIGKTNLSTPCFIANTSVYPILLYLTTISARRLYVILSIVWYIVKVVSAERFYVL